MNQTLFPTDLPEREWVEFPAYGYSAPVCGVIHRGSNPPVCGVPMGGIDTGCIDLEATVLFGYSTLFNSLIPRRGPLNQPFLGISIDSQTWVCALHPMHEPHETTSTWLTPVTMGRYKGVRSAQEIYYWGHYPVADYEFTLDEAPLSVGLRCWTPFIPGDVSVSNTPGSVFELHMRNDSARVQKGTAVFSFSGPSEAEAGTSRFKRRQIKKHVKGVAVISKQASYVLGVIGETQVRTGGFLGSEGTAWRAVDWQLPYARQ